MARVSKIEVQVNANTKNLSKGLDKAKKETSKFGNQINKIGGLIASAFAVNTLVNFGKEALALAGKFEGIQKAYNKLDNTSIFELREAVQGTVSDMELMRNTVVAATLGLEQSRMPELFAFAAQRANETGESVQFLVDSIVKGIGRKSPLILDNLGISAIALKEAMGGLSLEAASVADVTEAVSKIAKETTGDLSSLGDEAKTAGQEMQTLTASWTNLMVEIGLSQTETVGATSGILANVLNIVTAYVQYNNLRHELHRINKEEGKETDKQKVDFEQLLALEKLRLKLKKEIVKVEAENSSGKTENIQILLSVGEAEERLNKIIKIQLDLYKKRNAILDETKPKFNLQKQAVKGVTEEFETLGKVMTNVSDMIQRTNAEGIDSFREFGSVVVAITKKIIAALIAEGVTSAITGALKNPIIAALPGLNLALASAAGLGAAALFSSIVPSFAQGGMVTSPTLAMIGDNPGRKEAIIPSEMFGMLGGGILTTRISGNDLQIILDKNTKNVNTYN